MSQGKKDKTMIGTMAPVIPQRVPISGAQQQPAPSVPPSVPPPAAAPYPTAPPAHEAQTIMPVPQPTPGPMPGAAQPTVGMRPGASSNPNPSPGVPSSPGVGTPAAYAVEAEIFAGQELCGYAIKRKLAEGGMGVVYEGEHGKIGRRGAIKVLKLELCRSEEAVERFLQEARSVNAIRHENIVDIYDFGRDHYGRAFFVMEYLEGEPLSSRIRRGALPWFEAFPVLDQTLRALKAAHDKGFVHRDLKPDNIWLKYVDGRIQVKLLDFGIAKLVGTESPKEKLTQTGSVLGTPHYMSPEQINGSRDVDHRTDIYAMGVIAYEMFTGVTPFGGDTLQAIMTGHLFREPPRLADIPANLGVPPPIAEIVDRMLVKDAASRYDSVTDVLADLWDVNQNRTPGRAETLNRVRPTRMQLPQAPAQALAQVQVQGPGPAPRGKGKLVAIIGVAAAAAIAVAGFAIWKSKQESADAPVAATTTTPTTTTPAPPGPAQARPPAPVADKPLDHDAIRKEAQTTLRASLAEAEPAVRVQGSDALGKIKDQPAVPALTGLTEKDPDADVRGHAADALGAIGVPDSAPLLAKLEAAAPPPLKVWYASALARLGDKEARKRLLAYAKDKDLAVSFKAVLTLADVSLPGDKKAIAALKALAVHEAELSELAPFAGALILTKMAALRDPNARTILYKLLEEKHEGVRLAAAEGLARLGDDAGKKVLQEVLANEASPNRLVAAVAQIPLGEYGGYDLITAKLDDKDPETRRLAVRALGEIGERKSLKAIMALARDKSWTVRIAASAAIVAIVGLDPQVLAQASVDWTRSALGSQDWAVRKAAAGVLADMPEKEAVPLLAQAIADPDPKVRLAASKSAGKMKSADAAAKVAIAVKAETDPAVKEQQVKALGEIGSATSRDTLAQISEEPGRIGVIAAGSLIAVGDVSGKAKLEAAVAAPQPDLRLAAVQAASAAKNPIVVPTLKIGVADRVFDIRFTAAEGLSMFNAEKAAAVPVLTAALDSKDASVFGRALAALARLGEQIRDKVRTPAEMIDSTDPKLRLAAVPIVRTLTVSEGVPLLRRLVADSDQDVRRAGVDAIEAVAAKDKDQAIRLYKPLVSDDDPVVRSKASGQLSRLVEPPAAPPQTAAVTPAPAPDPAPVTPPAPPVDDALPKVKTAFDEATAAAAEVKTAGETFEALATEITTTTAAPARDDATIKHVEELATNLDEAATKLEAVATKIEAAAKAASDAAGASPSPDAAKLVADATALAHTARETATAARGKTAGAAKKAREYVKAETGDAQIFVAAADAAIAAGNLTDAKQNLDKAAKLIRGSGARGLDYSYGQLYDKLAARTQDPAAKLKLLKQAEEAFDRFAKTGTGPRAQRAKARLAELVDEIKDLGQP